MKQAFAHQTAMLQMLFKTSLAAAIVKATSSSVWARPVKPASYWDGAKYTPLSSIPLLRQTTENFRDKRTGMQACAIIVTDYEPISVVLLVMGHCW
jgi:hypothetical protein